MKHLGFATIVAVTLAASVGGAPREQYDYYLTGNAADVSGNTEFGLGLMGGRNVENGVISSTQPGGSIY